MTSLKKIQKIIKLNFDFSQRWFFCRK